jgi:hypothetical protein
MNSTMIVHQYIIDNQDLCDEATHVVVAAYDGWEAPSHRTRIFVAGNALADYIEEAITESTDQADTLGRVDWRDIAIALLADRDE